ncbi:hypothetical protein DFH08DRAFT_889219 [Mycena albidolilacea]|uniref:DUF6534 domain-containing protein n=1 Tax=Mycena albidolilacea TaxID=1033008 RepID=A0AAD7EG30_9AGAR|nr:hypothetical protein DFH08DRAFT_889219 [Mycena albidolilacea]
MSGVESIVPFIVSSWLNVAMYAFELVLCGFYFKRRSRPLLHKLGVWSLIVADGVCVLAVNFNVSLTITGAAFRNPHFFVAPIAAQIITTYVSAVIAQLFFCNLFYTLTHNILVSGVIVVLIAVHLGFSWVSAILLLLDPTATSGISFTTTTVGAVSCAATDIIVAVCLATKFGTLMRETTPGHATRSLVRRILILTVASGSICATITLLMMILLLKNNPAFTFLFVLQGRVYALSILGNFLLGIPTGSVAETTPSEPFGSTFSSPVFHIPDSMAKRSRPRSSVARVSRSVTDETPGISLPCPDHGEESFHLDDLPFTYPHGKADSDEGQSSSAGI